MGLKNGRMGFWVSPSGVDASGETGRMVLNSDYEHLQIHTTGSATVTGTPDPARPNYYYYSDYILSFANLGYRPLVMVGNAAANDRGASIPPALMMWQASQYQIATEVRSNGLTINVPETYATNTQIISWVVFKNRVYD